MTNDALHIFLPRTERTHRDARERRAYRIKSIIMSWSLPLPSRSVNGYSAHDGYIGTSWPTVKDDRYRSTQILLRIARLLFSSTCRNVVTMGHLDLQIQIPSPHSCPFGCLRRSRLLDGFRPARFFLDFRMARIGLFLYLNSAFL